MLIAGTVPGVIAGSVIRVELLPGAHVFDLMVSVVLLPLGIWLAATNPPRGRDTGRLPLAIPSPVLIMVAALVGCVGGIYGIGGGSILSPLLIGSGRPAAEVAPAALASTFVTSVAAWPRSRLVLHLHGPVAPAWSTGSRCIGGLAAAIPGPASSPVSLRR